MIGDESIQASIVAKLKALAPFDTVSSTEIREFQWQGDEFAYPNIRIELEKNEYEFDEQERCQLQYIEFSVYAFSESKSSKESSRIKSAVINQLVGAGFTTLGVKFNRVRLIDNVPAARHDERTFRTQAKFGSRIQNP